MPRIENKKLSVDTGGDDEDSTSAIVYGVTNGDFDLVNSDFDGSDSILNHSSSGDSHDSSSSSSNDEIPPRKLTALRGGHAAPLLHPADEVVSLRNRSYHTAKEHGSYQRGDNCDAGAPKGLKNVGNTCYANAVLQCLMSTALTNALLDPTTVTEFRRYSSNPDILLSGSGSVDSDEEDSVVSPTDIDLGKPQMEKGRKKGANMMERMRKASKIETSEPASKENKNNARIHNPDANTNTNANNELATTKARPSSSPQRPPMPEHDRQKRSERRRKNREDLHPRLQDTCEWLTRELGHFAREYHEEDSNRNENTSSQLWTNPAEWLSTPRPRYGEVDPSSITRCPQRLSKCLRPYQQEDAHEFLRAMLSTLVMNGHNKQLSSLFDGLLESSVTCKTCMRASLTRDRYMDLSLDIHSNHIETLTDALHGFTEVETLSGDNQVYCRNCDVKRTATKALRLATAPSILVCHLKRFAFDEYGRLVRLNKRVQFDLQLEIGDFMSRVNQARPPPYELMAVLVHQGQSCDSGHYLAYVRNHDEWFKCNDSEVSKVDVETVLRQQAYILIYEVEAMRQKDKFGRLSRQYFNPVFMEDDCVSFKGPNGTHGRQYDNKLQFSLKNMLCGLDESLWNDVCCLLAEHKKSQTKKQRRRSSNRSRSSVRSRSSIRPPRRGTTFDDANDLSTLGESTINSEDTSKLTLRRTTSSSRIYGAKTSRNTHPHHHSTLNLRRPELFYNFNTSATDPGGSTEEFLVRAHKQNQRKSRSARQLSEALDGELPPVQPRNSSQQDSDRRRRSKSNPSRR